MGKKARNYTKYRSLTGILGGVQVIGFMIRSRSPNSCRWSDQALKKGLKRKINPFNKIKNLSL